MKDSTKSSGITLKITWTVAAIVLLVITNVTSLLLWKPWQEKVSAARKITMSGEAVIKTEPDEYILAPYFEFTNPDRAKATEQLALQSTTITSKLKELGVNDAQIKSSTSGYDRFYNTVPGDPTANTLQLQYTITVTSKDTAQKVQDYLLTLQPKGQLSPIAQFSEQKRKQLESEAREQAMNDAKQKAEKTAKQLDAKVGKALNVSDGAGYGMPIAMSGAVTMEARAADVSAMSSVPVQAGLDEFRFSVTVEYELK
jgi:uncharacterized protein